MLKCALKFNRPLLTRTAPWKLYLQANSTEMASRASSRPDSSAEKLQYIVGHDKPHKEFYIKLEKDSKDKAILQYDYVRKGIVELYHTGVPESYRGRGIGKLLAKAALDHFVAEDMRLKVTCWYVQKYIDDNPIAQYTERVIP
ncbi:protein NATD1-like [Glandiceps talaboti]